MIIVSYPTQRNLGDADRHRRNPRPPHILACDTVGPIAYICKVFSGAVKHDHALAYINWAMRSGVEQSQPGPGIFLFPSLSPP
jgi:hypothetical protein